MTLRALFMVLSLALLQACVTNTTPPAGSANALMWLPLLGIRDDPERSRVRRSVDTLLRGGEFTPGPSLALAVSGDAVLDEQDPPFGFGSYYGGYAYFEPPPAPPGWIAIRAYDASNMQLVWQARVRRETVASMDDIELLRLLALTLTTLPGVTSPRASANDA